MRAVCLGVHIVDVLVRPVEGIPEGQNGALVEQIALSPAGTAGATAVALSRLGAEVHSAGALGADRLGDLLAELLAAEGVDTTQLVRRTDVQTSASVLPIRPDGSRPALHVIGANGAYGRDDIPRAEIAAATHLHVGAPEFLGGEVAAEVLAHARDAGVVTSADLLAPGDPGLLEWIAPALEQLDYLLPNEEQVLGLTGADDLLAGCRALIDRGVGCVAATRGADGALVVDRGQAVEVPAHPVEVIDTSGCGDAFSAGFIRGRALDLDLAHAAALGCATASFTAEGLGSDHGSYDLAAVRRRADALPR